jgi:hypothetical protein
MRVVAASKRPACVSVSCAYHFPGCILIVIQESP